MGIAQLREATTPPGLRRRPRHQEANMNSTTRLGTRLFAMAFAFICLAAAVNGQSSNFNTPTTDVMPQNELYLELDFDAKLSRFRDGGWQSYGIVSVYGIRKKTEIGLNTYFTRTSEGLEPVELQPNVKFQLHNSEDHGTAVAVGAVGYIPLKKNFTRDTFASVYAVGSKKFKKAWTPKLSLGAYQLIGAKRDSGDSRGLLLAVEQPVHSRVSVIVDWNTGKNRFGYAAAGLGITLTKRSFLYSAYYFGNEGRGNNFLGVYYGFSL